MSNPGHILVVDDDRMNRLTLFHAIQRLGYTGVTVESGRQALEMLETEQFDTVLLDIIMPEMDGFQVLEQIKGRTEFRDIPVIVISGLEEMESAARSIELGAEDYLTKPFNSILLKARLTASLEKKQYRDLERAYLQQEIMLRQNEKLATLGRLAAGMAHELNNPVAAAQRGVENLESIVDELRQTHLKLGESGLDDTQHVRLVSLVQEAEQRRQRSRTLDPLAYSDREAEIEACLRSHGVDRPWEYAAALVDIGFDGEDLAAFLNSFTPSQVPAVVSWLDGVSTLHGLLAEIRQGLQKVTQTVESLKSYSYMDQAPVQLVSVQDGLESTLEVLAISSDDRIVVHREYADELPRVEAYGSELNQVWSNILDNAVAAIDGHGEITLRTSGDSGSVRVEIEDSGHGIPAEILSKIFDPFFTTKPPGQGAGLGLTLSHNVIRKHGGTIEARSQPGLTCVVVTLPITPVHGAENSAPASRSDPATTTAYPATPSK